jgi:PAS domain S-box-containing protein
MKKINPAILIALLYFIMGVLWIYLTDKLSVASSSSTEFLYMLQTYKGILYIFITSIALFLLIRRSNRKLLKKGTEYEVLFEENPNPMHVFDSETLKFLAVNQAALQKFGYSREEFLSLTPKDIRPREDQEAFLKAVRESFDDYHNFGLWRLVKKNGEIIHAEVYRHKVVFQGRKAYLSLILDNTARFRAEEERNKLIQELTNQNLDLQQFAYITSHNLRAPIANIMGLVNLYRPGNQPDFNQQIISNLSESALNLDTVVHDLNELMVIRTQKKEEHQVVKLEPLLHFIKQSINADIDASQAHIHVDFAAPEVVSVRSYVQSILFNLLTNAIKYRSPQRPLEIEVFSYQEGNFICLGVQDNGLGIDLEKYQDKLFGMYKRFHQHIDGKGLGLHLVKTQIEALGGSIAVESAKGEGTTFKVMFPVEVAAVF